MGSICAVTAGAWMSPYTFARTVIVGRRLRRQTMPSSKPYEMVAIWLSGTDLEEPGDPLPSPGAERVGTARSCR